MAVLLYLSWHFEFPSWPGNLDLFGNFSQSNARESRRTKRENTNKRCLPLQPFWLTVTCGPGGHSGAGALRGPLNAQARAVPPSGQGEITASGRRNAPPVVPISPWSAPRQNEVHQHDWNSFVAELQPFFLQLRKSHTLATPQKRKKTETVRDECCLDRSAVRARVRDAAADAGWRRPAVLQFIPQWRYLSFGSRFFGPFSPRWVKKIERVLPSWVFGAQLVWIICDY